jgi:hypothetical protein
VPLMAISVSGYPPRSKGHSGRQVYVPPSVVADLAAYTEIDRAKIITEAADCERYRSWRCPLVMEDPARPTATAAARGVRSKVKVSALDGADRRRLLSTGRAGWNRRCSG